MSIFFGYFTDFGMFLVSFIPADIYAVRLALVIIGVVAPEFGISLSVIANVIMNAGEAFVKAIADTTCKNFGNIKIVFDISCVTLAIILSLIFFDFALVGTSECTAIVAIFTGVIVKFFNKNCTLPSISGVIGCFFPCSHCDKYF